MISPLRTAATEGLALAAHYADRFGWEPTAPDTRLDMWAHLTVAAGQTGPRHGHHAQDVRGFMVLLLERHLDVPLMYHWEDAPGRTADDVRDAFLGAATGEGEA